MTSLFGVTPAQPYMTPAELATLAGAAPCTLRVNINIDGVQDANGNFTLWTMPDSQVRDAANAGLQIIASCGGVMTPWDSAMEAKWRAFASAVVARYKPTGTFWVTNPTVPVKTLTYICGNEPSQSAAEYAALCDAFTEAAHLQKSDVRVSVGGLARPNDLAEFISYMLATLRNGPDQFYCLGVHPYWRGAGDCQNARTAMDNHGWSSVKLLVDEIAYQSEGSMTEAEQADGMQTFFQACLDHQEDWNLFRVLWYRWHDDPPPRNTQKTGMWRQDGTAKPSWDTFRFFALNQAP